MGLNLRNLPKPQILVAISVALTMAGVWAYAAIAPSVAAAVHEVLCKPYAIQYGFPIRALRWPAQLVQFDGLKDAAHHSRFVVAFHMGFSGRRAVIPCINGRRPDELMLGEYFNRTAPRQPSDLAVRYKIGNVQKTIAALLPHLSALKPHTWFVGKKAKRGLQLIVILVWKVSGKVKHYERHAERYVVFNLPAMAHDVGIGLAIGSTRANSSASLLVYFQNKRIFFQTIWPSEAPSMLAVHWLANKAALKLARTAFAVMGWSDQKQQREIRIASRRLANMPVEQAMLLAAGIVPRPLARLPHAEIDAMLVLAATDRARYSTNTFGGKRRLAVAKGPLGFPLSRYLVESRWPGGKIYAFAYTGDAGAKFAEKKEQQTFLFSANGAIVAYLTLASPHFTHAWYKPSDFSAGVLGLLPKHDTRRQTPAEFRAYRGPG